MEYIGGTPQAIALIERLKKSGNLIDVYDRDRVKKAKNPSLVNIKMMDKFDKKYGTEYHHHLLAIFVDKEVDANELIAIYPEFEEKFNDKLYEPNLIFINLATHQIFAYTIARKGNVMPDFIPHPIGKKEADVYERMSFIDVNATERWESLIRLDFAEVIDKLSGALETIANADYNLVYREIDSGHIQEMLAAGPNKHGLYIKDSWGGEEDDDEDAEGITQDELDYAIEEIDDLESDLSSGIKTIADFFPDKAIDYDNFCRDE